MEAAVGGGVASLLMKQTRPEHTRAASKREFRLALGNRSHHHLVYHADSPLPFYSPEVPASIQEIVRHSVGYFLGTGVNIFDLHVGAYETPHDLGIDPHVGPGANPPYESTTEWRIHENLLSHLRQGVDPIKEIIKATRQAGAAFFAGIRMNDIHHSAWNWHPKFWVDHPEYRMNEPAPWDERGWGALDFGRSAVRDYRKGIIAAYLERYDVDGIELDFNRFPLLFKSGEADRHRDVFTAYVREIRDLVEQTSVRRGHRIYLMARVPSVAEKCHRIGIDVLRWIRDEIVDIAVCATVRYAEFEMPVEDFLEAAQGRKALVFAGFEPIFTGETAPLLTPEMWRAVALHYWNAGVDGLHLFNNHYYQFHDLDEIHLHEIAYPASLEKVDKTYQVTRLSKELGLSGKGGFDTYASYPKQLPVTLAAAKPAPVRIFLEDKLTYQPSIKLRLRVEGLTPLDAVAVTFNGRRLTRLTRTPYTVRGSRAGFGRGMDIQWIYCPIQNLSWIRKGTNVVEVTLERRNEGISTPIVLTNVELDVKHRRT